jgi:hypothetical protein
MGSSGIHAGISGIALVRAADAVLRALGNDEITLLLPAATLPNDPSAQLGLVDPGTQQVVLSPVVVRSLTTPASGPRRQVEFLVSAATVATVLTDMNVASGEALFESALGLQYGNDLLHVEDVATEWFSGTPYLYRVRAVE